MASERDYHTYNRSAAYPRTKSRKDVSTMIICVRLLHTWTSSSHCSCLQMTELLKRYGEVHVISKVAV